MSCLPRPLFCQLFPHILWHHGRLHFIVAQGNCDCSFQFKAKKNKNKNKYIYEIKESIPSPQAKELAIRIQM